MQQSKAPPLPTEQPVPTRPIRMAPLKEDCRRTAGDYNETLRHCKRGLKMAKRVKLEYYEFTAQYDSGCLQAPPSSSQIPVNHQPDTHSLIIFGESLDMMLHVRGDEPMGFTDSAVAQSHSQVRVTASTLSDEGADPPLFQCESSCSKIKGRLLRPRSPFRSRHAEPKEQARASTKLGIKDRLDEEEHEDNRRD
ncbi:hypothetical protein FRB91_004223 [Serendipita sp. 411]|nr:hypothetical protein FRB91_004223 [Serendipita sp. 411]